MPAASHPIARRAQTVLLYKSTQRSLGASAARTRAFRPPPPLRLPPAAPRSGSARPLPRRVQGAEEPKRDALGRPACRAGPAGARAAAVRRAAGMPQAQAPHPARMRQGRPSPRPDAASVGVRGIAAARGIARQVRARGCRRRQGAPCRPQPARGPGRSGRRAITGPPRPTPLAICRKKPSEGPFNPVRLRGATACRGARLQAAPPRSRPP